MEYNKITLISIGRYVQSVIINNECHIIGGNDNNKHYKWDNKNRIFK